MKSKLVWNLLISAALLFSLLAGPVAAQAADGADSLTLYSSLLAADSRIGMTAAPGEGFESGSAWRSNKNLVEFYLIPQALGLGDITVGDIVSVSYATKKLTVPEGSADVDFGFYIYTEVDEDADSSWYGKRLTAEPYFAKDYDAPADQWNVWTTAGEKNVLTFYDTNNNGGLHGTYTDPTLAELLAGPYTWPNGKTVDYSSEKVMAFKFGTGSAWSAGFDGLLDSITIETTTKKVTIDLEAALPDVVYVDDDWALPSPEEWARLPFAGEGLYPGSNAFSTIQDAIAAVAPGGTVYVNGGEYVEQLVIDKSVKMVGAGVDATTVKAPASLPKSTNMASAIVMIKGEGVEVELSDLTVSGPGPSGCNSIAAGIAVYEGAYANIHDNRIADIRDEKDGGMSGCQNGSAIIVGSQTYGTTGTADITNNEVVRYQKRGILVENDGSSATITGNTVTGVGTTDIIGQNGIQVHYGANAILTGNTVTNNSYHKEGNDADWEASGILLWYSGDVTLAGGNEISGNDVSVYVQDTGTLTVGNEVFGPSSAPAEKALDFEYYGTGPVDLSEVTFAGAADDYDIERLVWHKIDDPALGMVEWVKGQVFAYDNDSLVAALNNAPEGSTINLKAGEYELGLTTIDRDLTVIGENKETTIIKPAQHTPGGANNRFWIGVNEGVEFNLSNVTLDGNNTLVNSKGEEVPVKVYEAIRYNGTGTFENNIVQNIWYGRVTGIGVAVRGNTIIRNNTFQNIERIAIHITTSAVESALVEGNTIIGKGDVYDTVNYGVELGWGAKATIRNNTISNNLGFAASDGSESGAIYVTTYFAEGTAAVIEGNTLFNNNAGIYVGYDANDTSTVTARNNKIYDNTFAVKTTAPQVDAANNYWGSAGGPLAGSLEGDVVVTPWCVDETCTGFAPEEGEVVLPEEASVEEVQAAINNAPEGTTIVLPEGTFTNTGGFEINRPGLTIKLSSGTIIQNNSPCFVVEADYTRIISEPGAVCKPTNGDHGIVVKDGVTDLVISGLEIDGADGTDGIHFEGAVTDIVILNNKIHSLAGNGIEFTAAPAGVVEIQGNLFKDNGEVAIVSPAQINAQYNSWGAYDAPVIDNVDTSNNTHVDLYLESSGTPWVDQVVKDQQIIYTVYGDLKNVMGASFTLNVPEGLTYQSHTLGGVFENEDLTVEDGKLVFDAYQIGDAVSGTKMALFSVTFTGSATGKHQLTLGSPADKFSMAPAEGSSNWIYANSLEGAEVTVISQPVLTSANLDDPFVTGVEQEYQVTLTNPDDGGSFSNVLVRFRLNGADASTIASLKYMEYDALGNELGWKDWTLNADADGLYGDYGPAAGFPMPNPYAATSRFLVTFAEPGVYPAELDVVDVPTGTVLAELDADVDVRANPVFTSDDLDGPFFVSYPQEFHVTLTNPTNGLDFSAVLVHLRVKGAALSDIASLEYWETEEEDGQPTGWRTLGLTQDGADLVGYYGPSTGFPLPKGYTAESLFRVKFAKAGSYTVELSLVDKAVNDRVLTTFTQTAAVNPAFTVTATVSMQGRIDRAGVEMTLTGLTERPFAYGPFTATSEDRLSSNLSFAPVVDGEYEITTNQARYLNVSGKTVTISAGKQSLNQLQLKGGNAVQDDVININDASLIANQYGYKGIEYDGDVNFSGEVDIFDLAMVGGNFDLTAAAAYADWTP